MKVIPARHPGKIIGSLIAISVVGAIITSIFTNPKWGWDVFTEWFFSEPVLSGLGRTVLLTAMATLAGAILGTALALARFSSSKLLSGVSWGYVWFMRSIPVIVLLLILNNLGYLYESIHIALPLTGTTLLDYPMVNLITPFTAAFLGLTLSESAFFAEIVRGGILAVDSGQTEAASSLGLSRSRQVFRIILPQAMKSILPTGFNEIIGLAKSTSMVYVLALPELFYTVQVIYRRNLEVIPLLMVATAWYLVIMTILSIAQFYIESYFSKGFKRVSTSSSALNKKKEKASRRSPSNVNNALYQTSFSSSVVSSGAPVKLHGISKSFNDLKVLEDINLDIDSGSITVILGPSGSGKSTLLRTINHLERADKGYISVGGELIGYKVHKNNLYELREKDVLKHRANIGMVFQNFNLFPHMTVLENIIEAPVHVKGVTRESAIKFARELLISVGLEEKINSYPGNLSGGQQQRVAIARALALRPKVLLFDEPTSALDPELVNEVLDVIKNLSKTGTTMIIVTHEFGFAREVASEIVFMERGRIIEKGKPENIFFNPENIRTREFLSKSL